MKTIAIANHKGGVGKTATTHALGEALAYEHGKRVLLVDNDSQASLTGACGISDVEKGLAEVIGSGGAIPLSEIIVKIGPNLALAPADLALAPLEIQLRSRAKPGYVLRDALATLDAYFDVVLIDCAPNLGLLTINALAASNGVMVLTQPQVLDLKGVQVFLSAVDRVRRDLNPELNLLGVLVTFYDDRFNHHKDAVSKMMENGYPVLDVRIGRSVRVAEAAAKGQSIISAASQNPQAEKYRKLATFVEKWLS
jgi:chromosome partitioning protein